MFLDEAIITVRGGNGGNGCVSWRHEKYIPKGGPDGGNGGQGGAVFLLADANTDTLSTFASQKLFAAGNGRAGRGKRMTGRSGSDLILHMPPGTVVRAADGTACADLAQDGDQVLVAHGGRGGFGNAHFKSSVRRKPDFAEKGEAGEEKHLALELKLVADVGIIGYPNVGKSTLISIISGARPKIANYPFTTIVPNLGVAAVSGRHFVVCDVPGLIEGASEGKGLGDRFLRHIERCGVLLHLLDIGRALQGTEISAERLAADYRAIRAELGKHSPALAGKDEIVVLNKKDLTTDDLRGVVRALKKAGVYVSASISAATTDGVAALLRRLLPIVLKARRTPRTRAQKPTIAVLHPHLDSNAMAAFRIERSPDGSIAVRGKRLEQFTAMTDFANPGGVLRFRDVCKRIGLLNALRRERGDSDAPVRIGTVDVRKYLF